MRGQEGGGRGRGAAAGPSQCVLCACVFSCVRVCRGAAAQPPGRSGGLTVRDGLQDPDARARPAERA